MDSLDDAIREAIQQLPGAFESQSAVPPSYRPESLDEYFQRDDDITLLPRAEVGREDEVTAESNARDAVIADFERANSEVGFEAIAFYVSFHNRTDDGKWGIFYYDDAVRALAIKIGRDLEITNDKKCYRLAIEIVRKHELFHFHFDLFALQQELTLARPLYNEYHRNLYQKVLFTKDCFEESLANASSVTGWSIYKHLAEGLVNRSFSSFSWSTGDLRIEDFVEFTELDPIPPAIFGSRAHGPTPIDKFVRDLCKQAPPGYCDFDRDASDLRSGLGGQLLYSCVNKKLPSPQAEWVGRSSAFAGRRHCPEYLLRSKGDDRPGVHRLITRVAGEIWEFHKYDADPWPSSPHGHNRETREKLDLAGGWIYDRNRNRRRRCTKKALAELRACVEKGWPDASLPPMMN